MEATQQRELPTSITEQWAKLSTEATALGALTASRVLHRAIAEWQSGLVKESVAAGASWEEIGEALGSTRQAAWARFRHLMEGSDDMPLKDERAEIRKRYDEIRRTAQARARELDERWRADRSRLKDQLNDNRQQLREAAQRHVGEKAALRAELRRAVDEFRRDLANGQGRPTN
jgi:hypothetical protein